MHASRLTHPVNTFLPPLLSGLAPRAVRTQQTDLSTAEKRQLLEKGGTADRDGMDTERVSGLGAGQ